MVISTRKSPRVNNNAGSCSRGQRMTSLAERSAGCGLEVGMGSRNLGRDPAVGTCQTLPVWNLQALWGNKGERRISITVCFDALSGHGGLSTAVEGLPVASPILSCPGTSVYPNGLLAQTVRNSPLSPQATHSAQPHHCPPSPPSPQAGLHSSPVPILSQTRPLTLLVTLPAWVE